MIDETLLLSGGVDSAALCHWRRPSLCIFVNYGQLAATAEFRAATAISDALGIPIENIEVDLRSLGAGTMAGNPSSCGNVTPEWWPFRNQLLITLAAMRMATTGHRSLLIGTVDGDYAHRDGTPAFADAINRLLALQEKEIHLLAPGRYWSSAELVRNSGIPPELLAWTHSCHTGDIPCGRCRGCAKHQKLFNDLGLAL